VILVIAQLCPYCFHPRHDGVRCKDTDCKCKGKAGFWRGLFEKLGNALGEAKFGGD
jgi:hypothetical protein